MTTANEIVTGAFGKLAMYQPGDTIPAEDSADALTRLNRFLNGMNGRGAVFPSVNLTLTDDVPVADHNVDDLEWALAKAMASQWGKQWLPADHAEARSGEARFIAAFMRVYPATPDAGLRSMPSTRRWWSIP